MLIAHSIISCYMYHIIILIILLCQRKQVRNVFLWCCSALECAIWKCDHFQFLLSCDIQMSHDPQESYSREECSEGVSTLTSTQNQQMESASLHAWSAPMKDTSFFSVPCVSEFTNITRLLHCAHMVGNHSHRNQSRN